MTGHPPQGDRRDLSGDEWPGDEWPGVERPEDERPDRAAASAEAFLAIATIGGLLALAGTAVYLLRLLGWLG